MFTIAFVLLVVILLLWSLQLSPSGPPKVLYFVGFIMELNIYDVNWTRSKFSGINVLLGEASICNIYIKEITCSMVVLKIVIRSTRFIFWKWPLVTCISMVKLYSRDLVLKPSLELSVVLVSFGSYWHLYYVFNILAMHVWRSAILSFQNFCSFKLLHILILSSALLQVNYSLSLIEKVDFGIYING